MQDKSKGCGGSPSSSLAYVVRQHDGLLQSRNTSLACEPMPVVMLSFLLEYNIVASQWAGPAFLICTQSTKIGKQIVRRPARVWTGEREKKRPMSGTTIEVTKDGLGPLSKPFLNRSGKGRDQDLCDYEEHGLQISRI